MVTNINKEIREALDVTNIDAVYQGPVEITDLQKELGTSGHLLVVRGDKAYQDQVGDLGNPKFWLYENLINSERVQRELREHSEYNLFDGVGLSGLEALGWHADKIGRKAVLVMAREHEGSQEFPKDILGRYNLEVIPGDKPAEEGYVKKQGEIIAARKNIIPLHQALYGARCLAPIGNKIVKQLEDIAISPDETFWVCAGGSNLYGIGSKIEGRFGATNNLVEPEGQRTIDPNLDVKNLSAVSEYANSRIHGYNLSDWDGKFDPEEFPLHAKHPNRYLLIDWKNTGKMGLEKVYGVTREQREKTEYLVKKINSKYNWTGTTYLALAPAIESARRGKNALVMAYGKGR
jgi:hypothetical protein